MLVVPLEYKQRQYFFKAACSNSSPSPYAHQLSVSTQASNRNYLFWIYNTQYSCLLLSAEFSQISFSLHQLPMLGDTYREARMSLFIGIQSTPIQTKYRYIYIICFLTPCCYGMCSISICSIKSFALYVIFFIFHMLNNSFAL